MTISSTPTSYAPSSEAYRRSSEWDVRYGAGNYLALIVMQAVSSLLAFASLWLATRALGPTGYGGLAAILAASQLITQAALQWSAPALVRYGCEEFVATGRLTAAFWTRLLILVPNLAIVMAASRWWLPPIAVWLHLPARAHPLILAHIAATVFSVHIQQGLLAAKLPRVQAVLLTAERAQILVALVVLTLIGRASVVSVAWSYIGAAVVISLIGLWRLRTLLAPRLFTDRALVNRMLRFSLPLIPNAFTLYLSTSYLDAFFITRYLTVADLGHYAIAYQLLGTVGQLPLLVGSLMLPFVITLQTHNRHQEIRRVLREFLPLLTLAWSLICALVAVLAGQLVPVVFGWQYQVIRPVLWPLAAAAALNGPALMAYFPVTNARSMTHICAAASATSACMNVAFDLLLIPRFGLVGCGWATVFGIAVSLLTVALSVERSLPEGRAWTLQATLPAVAGAAAAARGASGSVALAVAVLTTGLLALLHREAITAGTRALRATGILERLRWRLPHGE